MFTARENLVKNPISEISYEEFVYLTNVLSACYVPDAVLGS